jgi:hypothetical protein
MVLMCDRIEEVWCQEEDLVMSLKDQLWESHSDRQFPRDLEHLVGDGMERCKYEMRKNYFFIKN